ncbi:RBBP9/YdeN family alpha/beta hydrolase [Jatrophihabitans fulvus]
MPRRPSRAVPTLLLPGRRGAVEGDWTALLETELTAAGRVVRTVSSGASRDDMLAALDDALAALPDGGFDVVAHGDGALLWLHHTVSGRVAELPRPDRVALVAPPSPSATDDAGLLPPPLDLDAVRRAAEGTVLVGGADDPQCPEGIASAYGVPLKMATTVVPDGGHLDAASGFGQWPAMSSWCSRDNLAFF